MMIGVVLLLVLGFAAYALVTRSTGSAAAPGEERPRREAGPALAEALGYLGGILTVIALGLVISRFWPDMSTGARLALTGGGALALVAGGAAVPVATEGTLSRLRAVTWAAATAAAGLFAAILAADALDLRSIAAAAVTSGTVALVAGALWAWRSHALQQATALGAVVVFAGTAGALVATDTIGSIAVWALGAGLVAAGLTRRLERPALTELIGGVALVVGAGWLSGQAAWGGAGVLLGAASALGLLALASVPGLAPEHQDRVAFALLGVGAAFQAFPMAIGYFAYEAGVVTGLVVWALGAVVVAAGLRHLVQPNRIAEVVGGIAMLVGAAVTGAQWAGFAPIFGVVTAIGLLALGMIPGEVLLSVLGSIGLVVNVPWLIAHFFPGEGSVPLILLAVGALLLVAAIVVSRTGGRSHGGLGPHGVGHAH